MKPFFQKHHRLIFYSAWIILGLIQSGLTELQDDEAYYWVYSRYPDFGYFDHPPMIALLIRMGYAIIPGALGVRLFPLLLNVLSLLIIEQLTGKKNPLLFYTIALSIAVLQITGFSAVPDIPLIFFTALFFLCYKQFITRSSLLNSVALGLAIAALLYSKYHAVLIVFFTFLSNIRLAAKKEAWLAMMIALGLFAPHLWWQYQHNWVSFRYHLFESNVNAYKFSFTTDYLLGQLLLPGPVAGFILLPAAFMYRPKDQTERALRLTMIGIYLFFLLSSFRGKVEGNWTSPVIVALMVLAYGWMQEHQRWYSVLYKLLPLTLLLVLFARIIMIVDILPVKEIKKRYHAWKEWPAVMRGKTKGLPVVFSNSYQRASKYWFYSGQMTYSQNDCHERRNNYNFWPVENELLGKPVYFMDIYRLYRFPDSLETPIGYVGFRYDSAFASFARINFTTTQRSYTVKTGDRLDLEGTTSMPAEYSLFIHQHPDRTDSVKLFFFDKAGFISETATPLTLRDLTGPSFRFSAVPPLPPGHYYFRFSIEVAGYNATHNSEKIDLFVR